MFPVCVCAVIDFLLVFNLNFFPSLVLLSFVLVACVLPSYSIFHYVIIIVVVIVTVVVLIVC